MHANSVSSHAPDLMRPAYAPATIHVPVSGGIHAPYLYSTCGYHAGAALAVAPSSTFAVLQAIGRRGICGP